MYNDLINFWPKIKKGGYVGGDDIVYEEVLNDVKKFCKEFKNVSFEVATIQEFESSERFDLVLGVEVLLHVPPTDITSVINKLVGFVSHDMVNLDFNDDWHPKIRAPHNFVHQYKEIYENIERVDKVIKHPLNERQSIFHTKIIQQ